MLEHVDAHRRERLLGASPASAAGWPASRGTCSIVRPSPPTPTMPNAFASCRATGIAATVTPAPVLQVLRDHLPRVHPVHVVGAEDDHELGVLVVDQVHRLEDRVRGAGVPVRPEPLLRGHRRHVVAEQVAHPPGDGDVPVEAVALVLGEYADLPDAAVGQVGQREVDQPVHAAERHRGLGPVVRQRRQPRARPARQHDSQYRRVRHVSPPGDHLLPMLHPHRAQPPAGVLSPWRSCKPMVYDRGRGTAQSRDHRGGNRRPRRRRGPARGRLGRHRVRAGGVARAGRGRAGAGA